MRALSEVFFFFSSKPSSLFDEIFPEAVVAKVTNSLAPHNDGREVKERKREECLIERDSPRSPTRRSVVIYPYRTLSASMVLYPPKKRACKWVSRRKQLVRDLLRVKGVFSIRKSNRETNEELQRGKG